MCGLVMVLLLLYFPELSYEDQSFWAPGFVIILFEGVVDKGGHRMRVCLSLMIALALRPGLLFTTRIVFFWINPMFKPPSPK